MIRIAPKVLASDSRQKRMPDFASRCCAETDGNVNFAAQPRTLKFTTSGCEVTAEMILSRT